MSSASEKLARTREQRFKHNGSVRHELMKRIFSRASSGLFRKILIGFTQHHFCDGSQTNGGSTLPPFRYLRRESAAEKIKHKSGAGFTLVELIISISIFGILLGITVYDFRIAQRHDDLRQAALKLASSLQEMQNLSMTGIVLPGRELPIGGYGVHIDLNTPGTSEKQFRLFADRETYIGDSSSCSESANGRYDLAYCPQINNDCACLYNTPSDPPNPPNDDPVPPDTVTFPNNVVIVRIDIVDPDLINPIGCTGCTDADISFRPPKPQPFVGSQAAAFGPDIKPAKQRLTAKITLKHTGINRCRRVTVVGASGQISEELLEPADPNCP